MMIGMIALWIFFPPATSCGSSSAKSVRFPRNCCRRRSPAGDIKNSTAAVAAATTAGDGAVE